MKCLLDFLRIAGGLSLPVRGAWVEIGDGDVERRGAVRRSPCGERGLKSRRQRWKGQNYKSLPVRGAWVEMLSLQTDNFTRNIVAPRAGSVG